MDTFVKSEQIIVMENGNGSPCINLTSVPKETCTTLIEHKCDFIILEGMGRAIHTNLHAHFTVGKRSKYNLPRIQTQRKFRLQTRLWTWVAYKYFIFLKIDGFLREIPPRILLFWHLEVNLRRLRVSGPILTLFSRAQISWTDDIRPNRIFSLEHLTPKVYGDSISADTAPTGGWNQLIKLKTSNAKGFCYSHLTVSKLLSFDCKLNSLSKLGIFSLF